MTIQVLWTVGVSTWIVRRDGIEEENVVSDQVVGNVTDIGVKSEKDNIQPHFESSLESVPNLE